MQDFSFLGCFERKPKHEDCSLWNFYDSTTINQLPNLSLEVSCIRLNRSNSTVICCQLFHVKGLHI